MNPLLQQHLHPCKWLIVNQVRSRPSTHICSFVFTSIIVVCVLCHLHTFTRELEEEGRSPFSFRNSAISSIFLENFAIFPISLRNLAVFPSSLRNLAIFPSPLEICRFSPSPLEIWRFSPSPITHLAISRFSVLFLLNFCHFPSPFAMPLHDIYELKEIAFSGVLCIIAECFTISYH